MSFISYAQNFEDVMLWRALKHIKEGFYIDVGAKHPIIDSVSLAFYEHGWRGIHVEPSVYYAALLRENRPDEIVIEAAVGKKRGILKFFEIPETGLSTGDPDVAERHRASGYVIHEKDVPCIKLADIFKAHAKQQIHWLKIDVEGLEKDVLQGWLPSKERPWVVVVESTRPSTQIEAYVEWEKLILDRGYEFVFFDGLNRYYLSTKHLELKGAFLASPNIFDDFVLNGTASAPYCSLLNKRIAARDQELVAQAAQRHAEIQQVEASAQKLQSELDVAKVHTGDLTAQLGEKSEALASREATLTEQRAHSQWLENEWNVAKVKTDDLNQALHETLERKHEAQIATVKAEAKAQQATERAAQAEETSRQATERAAQAEKAMNAIYASHSWRFTAPLRWAGKTARWFLLGSVAWLTFAPMSRPRRVVSRIKDVTKSLAHRILAIGLQGIRAVPYLKCVLLYAVRRFPSVGAPFLAFAMAHPRALTLRTVSRKSAVTQAHHIPLRSQRSLTFVPTKTRRVLYYYVDHTIDCPVNTGMQRVARGLARGLIDAGEDVVFVRWSPEAKAIVKINRDQLKHLCEWQGPSMSPKMTAVYPAPDSPDEPIDQHDCCDGSWLVVPEVTHINFHGYATTLDVLMAAKEAKLKTAFIFYDAIPLRRNEFASTAPLHAEYMQHLLLVDLVVPISRWSARDLVSFFVHHEKSALTAIPVVEPLLLPGETRLTEGPVKSSIATQKIILSVGTIELRKNQGVLLEAFEAFCARHPNADWKLVLAGNLHQNMATEVNLAVARNKKIVYRGNISDADIAELYRTCTFTVFPSKEEGFGLPIVESLDYGKPCICASFGAMAEAAEGGGCLTVDVRNSETLTSAIEALATNNSAALNRLIGEIAQREAVTWSHYTDAFRALLDSSGNWKNALGTVYYCVHSTCKTQFNSGIQRVVRSLARSLMETGVRLTPVQWDSHLNSFIGVTGAELEYLSRWNGPSPDQWNYEFDAEQVSSRYWLLSAELLIDSDDLDSKTLERWARAKGLRTAWIFYDVIPWKLKDAYADTFVTLHTLYMRGLETASLIFPISEYSASEFLRVIDAEGIRMPDQFDRIVAKTLPGEFPESDRIYQVSQPCKGIVRILCVSTIESRKNHLGLLRAFEAVQLKTNSKLELWLVGRAAPEPELIAEVNRRVDSNPAIYWEQEADDSRLRELYQYCDFTVFPSIEEGFGLPILESLWNARPCICRNSGAMAEVAVGGGCLMTDTADVESLASAIMQLITDEGLRLKLAQEAVSRPFKKWCDYAEEIAKSLAEERVVPSKKSSVVPENESQFRANMVNLEMRPLLSICITTYNRAEWLALSLKNLARLMPVPIPGVEIVVCDNTSTDHTPNIVKPYEGRSDFRYYRNPSNVGMLGNLRVTAHHARGQYIWVLGDDDLVMPGAIEKVLVAIHQNPDVALVYLNYSYTREEDAKKIKNLDAFFSSATPITNSTPDLVAPISRLSTFSENLFTAIYCLIFRRDHALRAYTQDTSGRPFSTMLTCIPTTYHVLHNMMHEQGVWLGTPQVVVNMNVSWLKYATICVLERIPEAFDLAEKMGALSDEVDRCRIAQLSNVWHYFGEILKDDPEGNATYFNPTRFFSRFKHLREFQVRIPEIIEAYREAHLANPKRFPVSPEDLFPASFD